MNYISLFSPHHVAVLADWLAEKAELLLQLEFPHSGGSGTARTVHSLAEIKRAVQAIGHPEVEISVWKNRTLAEFESDQGLPGDLPWIYAHPDEVMYLSVRKNRNSYARYLDDPGKYAQALAEWDG